MYRAKRRRTPYKARGWNLKQRRVIAELIRTPPPLWVMAMHKAMADLAQALEAAWRKAFPPMA